MNKQEEIRQGLIDFILKFWDTIPDDKFAVEQVVDQVLPYLHSQGVVIEIKRKLPYKWDIIIRKHSYPPYKKFITYALRNKDGKMFGYVQKYQSLTGYKCFEKPVYYCIYLGDENYAHSYKSAPTLKKTKEMLIERFLESKDNPDNGIPTGYAKVEPLV